MYDRRRNLGSLSFVRGAMPVSPLNAAIEDNRRRLWLICYRMTGRTSDADDLCQEAIARAIEREDTVANADPTTVIGIADRARAKAGDVRHGKPGFGGSTTAHPDRAACRT